jgi:uncharacterized cysteine cluster protein YcgN (CxxCxxCC family)
MGGAPFWKTKKLDEMSREEWESLCDGCGLCCLEKVRDEITGEIRELTVSCRHLDMDRCRCEIYEVRTIVNPECVRLTPENVKESPWLPSTCAYRIVADGGDLGRWHSLLSGDPGTVHEAGISARHRAVNGKFVHPDDIRQQGRPWREKASGRVLQRRIGK